MTHRQCQQFSWWWANDPKTQLVQFLVDHICGHGEIANAHLQVITNACNTGPDVDNAKLLICNRNSPWTFWSQLVCCHYIISLNLVNVGLVKMLHMECIKVVGTACYNRWCLCNASCPVSDMYFLYLFLLFHLYFDLIATIECCRFLMTIIKDEHVLLHAYLVTHNKALFSCC